MSEEKPKKFVERLIDRVDALVIGLSEGEERTDLVKQVDELRARTALYREHPGLSDLDEAKGFQSLILACAQALVRHDVPMDDETFRFVLRWGEPRVPHTVSSYATEAFYHRLTQYLKIIETLNEPDYEEKKKEALDLKSFVDQIKPNEHTDREILLEVKERIDKVGKDMRRFGL